jgi:hypothetical protein
MIIYMEDHPEAEDFFKNVNDDDDDEGETSPVVEFPGIYEG